MTFQFFVTAHRTYEILTSIIVQADNIDEAYKKLIERDFYDIDTIYETPTDDPVEIIDIEHRDIILH